MPSTTMVHVRVDEKIKEEASATLAKMGISVSDAVRMMLVRVAAEKALPPCFWQSRQWQTIAMNGVRGVVNRTCPQRQPPLRVSLVLIILTVDVKE